ncbi:uncharacterized protein TRIADDRAFT_60169 [Trichoplax adhaerens]|uniref:DPY30 domain-containing protein 1 n=1 Tax=Trichoplax adhaerens TaxID=10228 RepID=B3S7H7_TRIAD|nr:hypothetical protein TRIADDRAFT_60169 [Trichoplax adhaerens]EDV21200.1 hypothetical protein TRIADDRAFT_60169 [Trichoplax adhaerens]|eukprot:XP_002116167.1 hypothetical protein TRIADDRAFT_60169 [Trichoplax adhaerens]
MDVDYLKKNVSDALAEGLKEVVEKRPGDPIEFLGHWLIKYRQNQLDNQKIQNIILAGDQDKELEEEEKIRQEILEIEREEERKRKIQEEILRLEKAREEARKREEAELAASIQEARITNADLVDKKEEEKVEVPQSPIIIGDGEEEERDDDDQSRGSSRSVADSRDGEERPSTVDKESEIDPEAGKD